MKSTIKSQPTQSNPSWGTGTVPELNYESAPQCHSPVSLYIRRPRDSPPTFFLHTSVPVGDPSSVCPYRRRRTFDIDKNEDDNWDALAGCFWYRILSLTDPPMIMMILQHLDLTLDADPRRLCCLVRMHSLWYLLKSKYLKVISVLYVFLLSRSLSDKNPRYGIRPVLHPETES